MLKIWVINSALKKVNQVKVPEAQFSYFKVLSVRAQNFRAWTYF